MTDEWVEGETASRIYQLTEDGGAANLTGLTMTLVLIARDGVTEIDTIGDVTSEGDPTSGQVRFAPDAADLTASQSPLLVRFKATNGSAVKYFPKGLPGRFVVRKP